MIRPKPYRVPATCPVCGTGHRVEMYDPEIMVIAPCKRCRRRTFRCACGWRGGLQDAGIRFAEPGYCCPECERPLRLDGVTLPSSGALLELPEIIYAETT